MSVCFMDFKKPIFYFKIKDFFLSNEKESYYMINRSDIKEYNGSVNEYNSIQTQIRNTLSEKLNIDKNDIVPVSEEDYLLSIPY